MLDFKPAVATLRWLLESVCNDSSAALSIRQCFRSSVEFEQSSFIRLWTSSSLLWAPACGLKTFEDILSVSDKIHTNLATMPKDLHQIADGFIYFLHHSQYIRYCPQHNSKHATDTYVKITSDLLRFLCNLRIETARTLFAHGQCDWSDVWWDSTCSAGVLSQRMPQTDGTLSSCEIALKKPKDAWKTLIY